MMSRMTRSAGVVAQPRQHVAARGQPLDGVARARQVVGDQLGDVGVVFDDENAGHASLGTIPASGERAEQPPGAVPRSPAHTVPFQRQPAPALPINRPETVVNGPVGRGTTLGLEHTRR